MPMVILPAVIGAVVSGFASGLAIGITFSWIAAGITLAAGLLLGVIGQALAPKPSKPNSQDFGSRSSEIIREVRSPIAVRVIAIGEVRVGGKVVFVESTNNNQFLHLVIAFTGHEIDGFQEIILDDEPVYDGEINSSDGLVNAGRFVNKVKIRKHLGTVDQVADPDLVGVGGWTADHILNGISYIYERLEFNTDVFPTGIPETSAYLRGAKFEEIRGSGDFGGGGGGGGGGGSGSGTAVTRSGLGGFERPYGSFAGKSTGGGGGLHPVTHITRSGLGGFERRYSIPPSTGFGPHPVGRITRSGIGGFSRRYGSFHGKNEIESTATIWTQNSALCIRGYLRLTHANGGLSFTIGEFNQDTFVNAANISDEFVDVPEQEMVVTGVDTSNDVMKFDDDLLPFCTGDRVDVRTDGVLPAGLDSSPKYVIIFRRKKNQNAGTGVRLAETYDDAMAGNAIDITDVGSGNHTVVKTGEPRYTCNGVIETDRIPADIITDMLTSMGGRMAYIGDQWFIRAAAWEPPVVTYDEGDIRASAGDQGGVRIIPKRPLNERFNAVVGTYSAQVNYGVPSNYPIVRNASYRTADGGEEVTQDHDLAFTNRSGTAQRLAKILLERHRREVGAQVPFNLSGLQSQALDTIAWTYSKAGFSSKYFDILNFTLKSDLQDGVPTLGCDTVLQETDSAVYEWNHGEESVVNPSLISNLPNPFHVSNPTNLDANSTPVFTSAGDTFAKVTITWDLPLDQFVTSGGQIEIQWRLTGETRWQPSFFVDGNLTEAPLATPFAHETVLDIQARSVNSLGVRSSFWQQILGYVVGSSPASTDPTTDDGLVSDATTLTADDGGVTEGTSNTIDDGSV